MSTSPGSISIHPQCGTRRPLSVTLSTQIYLCQINRGTKMMDSDLVMTCSPRLPHSSATNWPIRQSIGPMIFMCLRLCIVYHPGSSVLCSCLSFTIIILLLPFGCLPVSFCLPIPSWIIFSCHRQTIESAPLIPRPLFPHLSIIFSLLLFALDLLETK